MSWQVTILVVPPLEVDRLKEKQYAYLRAPVIYQDQLSCPNSLNDYGLSLCGASAMTPYG